MALGRIYFMGATEAAQDGIKGICEHESVSRFPRVAVEGLEMKVLSKLVTIKLLNLKIRKNI